MYFLSLDVHILQPRYRGWTHRNVFCSTRALRGSADRNTVYRLKKKCFSCTCGFLGVGGGRQGQCREGRAHVRRPFFRPDFWTPIMSAPPGFHFCLSILDPNYEAQFFICSLWLTFSDLVLKVPTTHIRGADMSVTVHLDPIFNVESEKTSLESWRNNPEKL